ncbi:MAG: hypothetical protein ACKOBV_02610 [Candidatus Kapaibacterium sp.]
MRTLFISTITFITLAFLVAPDMDAGGRGGSFGGSRGGSFGGSRGGSFGGSRSYRSYSSPRSATRPAPSSGYNGGSSFGGSRSSGTSMFRSGGRMNSAQEYTRSYGVPRRTETAPMRGSDGVSRNYVFNQYGGYADGLMTGYAMGRMSWWWFTPFHPAFYYTAPPYVMRPDGTMEYFPPTFSFGKLLLTLVIVAAVVFIIVVMIRNRRRRMNGPVDLSQSSFG